MLRKSDYIRLTVILILQLCLLNAPLLAENDPSPSGIKNQPTNLRFPSATLDVGMSRLFHLRDGNVINGTIIEIIGDSTAVVETPDGTLRIPTWEILEEMVDLVKQDGTRFEGPMLSEDDFSVSVKTPYGVVVVLKRDVIAMDRYYGDKKVSWTEVERRFLATEELIDIFLDPTAIPLQPHTIYLSGLSLGYGFTENFTLRTRFGHNFGGDLNLRPLFRVYHRTTGASELSLSVGVNLYSRHSMKTEALKYSHWLVDKRGSVEIRLDEEDSPEIEEALVDEESRQFFASTYMVLSQRESLPSGRGKWGWHLGTQISSLTFSEPKLNPGFEWDSEFAIPYRVWVAMDYDLSKRVKFLIEVFADNGHKYVDLNDVIDAYFDFGGTPFMIDTKHGDYQPLDLDFGFLWSKSDNFRLGIHFQSPYLNFYWKW